MALKTNLSGVELADAAARIRSGETWKSVAALYGVDRCDLCRHFRLAGLDYRRRYYKCRIRNLDVPDDPAALGYIAGMIDGEGSIAYQISYVEHRSYSVCIANTDRSVMDWLLRFGGKVTTRHRPPHRDCYHWRIHAKQDVVALLEAVLPYLIIKRGLALEALAHIRPAPLSLPATLDS